MWALVAFVVTELIALLGVHQKPSTIFDEAAHLDYVVKLAHGDMPRVYEPLGQVALAEFACDEPRGGAWAQLEKCGSDHYTPELAPYGGLSTATNYAPTYYLATAVPYRVCEELTPWAPRTCARVANTGWLAAAAAGFFVLMVLLGCSKPVSLIVSVGTSVAPAILLQGITVNPDAAVQAAVAWMAVLAVRLATSERLSAYAQVGVLGIVGLVAVTAKETALIGFAVTLLLLGFLITARQPRSLQVKRWAAVSVVFGAVVGLAALSRLAQPVLRGVGGDNPMEDAAQIPFDALDQTAVVRLQHLDGPLHRPGVGRPREPVAVRHQRGHDRDGVGPGSADQAPRAGRCRRVGAAVGGSRGSAFAVAAIAAAAVLPAGAGRADLGRLRLRPHPAALLHRDGHPADRARDRHRGEPLGEVVLGDGARPDGRAGGRLAADGLIARR